MIVEENGIPTSHRMTKIVGRPGAVPKRIFTAMNFSLTRREVLQKSAGLLAAGAAYPLVSARGADTESSAVYLPSLYERAKLAMHCLVEHCDKSRSYLPYFYTRMSDRPPTMFLAIWSYGDGQGRSVDALSLLRHLTGESLDQPADRAMRASLIGLLGVDGLSWCPAEPWTLPTPHTRTNWLQQGTLLALTSLYQLTGEARYRRLTEKNIHALAGMLVRRPEGWLAYPSDVYTPIDGWGPTPADPANPFSLWNATVCMPALRYYRLTGHEPAFQLASDLIDGGLKDSDHGKKLFKLGHFHCQSRFVTSLLMRGILKTDKTDVELAESLYREARTKGTQSGWFPEQINVPADNRANLSETCCLTDMLEIAVLLAKHRHPVYWHDVERYVRNHLLVHQIVDTGWVAEMTPTPLEQHLLRDFGDGRQTTGGVVRGQQAIPTLVGGFAGWGAVTAMSDDSPASNSNQHCCNAAGARALFDAWCYAVSDKDSVFEVNLHVHRNHAAAEITAMEAINPRPALPALPAGGSDEVGGLQIKMKQQRRLRIRVPEFVAAKEMLVSINRKTSVAREDGVFLDLGIVRPGDRIEVLFPMKARTTKEQIAPGVFEFHWRGATVLDASPRQKIRPLFEPDRLKKSPPQLGPEVNTEMESL
jgi:hypothetical protein